MSDVTETSEKQAEEAASTTTKATPPPSHADMFFRYVASLANAAGVQAFTMAVAVPKEDGTSAILSVAAGAGGTSTEWQEETARLLGESATKAAKTIVAADKSEASVEVV